uniref:Uncharacterized protein n=1 Tax=Anguilla anguilla TaxID=7936 RepID=A0A0E9SV14_ANGAN
MSKCDSDSSPTNRTHGVRDPEKPPGPGHHLSSNIENKKGITVSPIFHECNFGHDVSNTINITANIVNGIVVYIIYTLYNLYIVYTYCSVFGTVFFLI